MRQFLEFEKVRFILVGAFNTGFDFLLLNVFVLVLGMSVLIGNTLSVVICITASYFLNHYFVFKSEDKVNLRKFMTFVLVTGFSSLFLQSLIIAGFSRLVNSDFGHSLFMISSLSNHLAVELNIAKALAVLVGMVWNFLLYKYLIFKKPIAPEQAGPTDSKTSFN